MSALKEDLFSTMYHLSFNHVQDNWEVGIHNLLAHGRHIRLWKPVTGLLQVHEDLLLERTQARVRSALLYKWAESKRPSTAPRKEALRVKKKLGRGQVGAMALSDQGGKEQTLSFAVSRAQGIPKGINSQTYLKVNIM